VIKYNGQAILDTRARYNIEMINNVHREVDEERLRISGEECDKFIRE